MPSMTLKDWIELGILVLLTGNTVARWIQRRETVDQNLGLRVATLEEGQDEKADVAEVARLEGEIEKVEQALKAATTQVGDAFHRKLNQVNVDIGKLASQRDVDTLRRDVEQLRARIDDHIDRNKH